jgi:hypothetical protein
MQSVLGSPRAEEGKAADKRLQTIIGQARKLPPLFELLYICGMMQRHPEYERDLVHVLHLRYRKWLPSIWPGISRQIANEALGQNRLPAPMPSDDPPQPRADIFREAEERHAQQRSLPMGSQRQRRCLEQELLWRREDAEDWRFFRALWQYRLAQSAKLGRDLDTLGKENANNAARHGVCFHPEQLARDIQHLAADLQAALGRMSAVVWSLLLDALLEKRAADLRIPDALWNHLRPYLRSLLGGSDSHVVEVIPGDTGIMQLKPDEVSLLVIHSDGMESDLLKKKVARHRQLDIPLILLGNTNAVFTGIPLVRSGERSRAWTRNEAIKQSADTFTLPLRTFMQRMERHYILEVLGSQGGVKSKACEQLGISRQTLYAKLASEVE